MKNIRLIAFLFIAGLLWAEDFCLGAEEKNIQVDLRSDYDFQKEELITSAKLIMPCVEVRGALEGSKRNYGFSFSGKSLFPKLPVVIKAGNLSVGGSLAKLNSPAIYSSISPFIASSVRISGLDVSLPQYNNFSSPPSYFFDIGLKAGEILKKLSLSMLYKNDKDAGDSFIVSGQIKVKALGKSDLAYCFTGGLYPYQKKKLTGWYTEENYYHEGRHLCFNNQFSFLLGGYSSLFIVSTYQSPFADFAHTWRLENILKAGNFTFSCNCFYNPNEQLITSSDKKLRPLLQFSAGGHYRFLTHGYPPLSITCGINSLVQINLADKKHSLKTSAGVNYSTGDFSGKLITDINAKLIEESTGIKAVFEDGSLETADTFYINNFTCSLSGKFTFAPYSNNTKWCFSEKIAFSCSWSDKKGIFNLGGKGDLTFMQKNQVNKKSYSGGFFIKLKVDWFSLEVNAGI